MKNRGNFFKKLYDECGDIQFILRYYPEDESKESIERRYKIVMMTALPILLSRVRAIFFLLSSFLSFLLGALLTSIFKG